MKVYEYQRVSTNKQDKEQQHNTVVEYCDAHGLQIFKSVFDEGVSGGVSYKDRKLIKLLGVMNEGDMLIVSEISRLGRSMSDLSSLVNDELKPRKLKLVVVKSSISLNCQSITAVDEFILNALAFAAQIEKEMIQSRIQSKMDVIKTNIKEGGHVVQKGKRKGQVIHKLGNPHLSEPGATSAAVKASGKARAARARSNPNNMEFARLLKLHEMYNGALTLDGVDLFVEALNKAGAKTSTGLPFNRNRAWATFTSLKRQGIIS